MENIALSKGNMKPLLGRAMDVFANTINGSQTSYVAQPSRADSDGSVSVADKEYMYPRGITRTVGTTSKRTCQPPTSHPVDRRLRDLCLAACRFTVEKILHKTVSDSPAFSTT
ncbi:unnamed protein product [Citrullus colocynthis]|uniref:Uncharacterized protein n=1 Tax=Citrullus colocynthis TaxID=252529 RepID=A0ABP0Y363_9ROSI